MKTNSLILGAAALMLATACSNDEVVQTAENSRAIGFSSFVNNATRATDNTAANLTKINVYGVTSHSTDNTVDPIVVFNGTEVTKSDNAWSYGTNYRYWMPNFNYTFAAVAPAGAAGTTTADGVKVTQGTGSAYGGITAVELTNNGKVDLLYDAQDAPYSSASNTEGTKWGDVVPFNLRHILSRVRFEFENQLAEGHRITIKDLTITNAMTTGSFNPIDQKWTVSNGNNIAFDFNEADGANACPAAAEANASAKSEPSYLFPTVETTNEDYEEVAYEVSFKIALEVKDASGEYKTLTGNNPYVHTVTIPSIKYNYGYSYAFKTVITQNNVDPENPLEPIVFTATVNNWATPEGGDDFTVPSTPATTPAEGGNE